MGFMFLSTTTTTTTTITTTTYSIVHTYYNTGTFINLLFLVKT